jgi:hypothetical protein
MSTTQKTSTMQEKPADPRDIALAELRQQVETLEAAVASLQELQAGTLRGCPCGRQVGDRTRLFFMNGTAYCDSGHFSHYGSRDE